MDNKELVILAGRGSGGGGGASDAVRYTEQTLTDEQKTQARNNIGSAASSSVSSLATVVQGLVTYNINVSGTTPTITPADNTIYKCGELTSLTISNPPATGAYSIVFTSGSTATTTTIPETILGLESFAAEANTLYEINVLDNRAVVGSWAVTP